MVLTPLRDSVITNAFSRYRPLVELTARHLDASRPEAATEPSFALPSDDAWWEDFFSPSPVAVADLGTYKGCRLLFLDLMRTPGVQTTKSFASLTMVARAAHHTARMAEPVIIVSPSSGNKAMALRAAVARAYERGFASPDTLRVVAVLPHSSIRKLRSSALSCSPERQAANPVIIHECRPAERVKTDVLSAVSAAVPESSGWRTWYSLSLDNYRSADALRAFVEHEYAPTTSSPQPRWHAHAVSSAYGLLGYSLGLTVLDHALRAASDIPSPIVRHPRFFLVQQAATSRLVREVHGIADAPTYSYRSSTGMYHQDSSLVFPAAIHDPEEVIDPTFYTASPGTAGEVAAVTACHGGGGVVVSAAECRRSYATIRALLRTANHDLPGDPERLAEWSVVMAFAGVMRGIDSGQIGEGDEVVIHGSGMYVDDGLQPQEAGGYQYTQSPLELEQAMRAAALA